MLSHASARGVLIVEDFEDARRMYAEYLRFAGLQVFEACDGIEAVTCAGQVLPDIIIMDLSLPRLDGWEAARRIKGNPATSGIAIVALTAFTDAESHQRAIAAGCLSVCTKPCDPEDLLFTINVVLGGAPA